MIVLFMLAFSAALGGFLFGFDTAVINGAVLELQKRFQATQLEVGLSVSVALLASAAGAFLAPMIADRVGRLRVMQVSALMFGVSALGSGLPIGLWDFIFWRVVGGVAVGAASVVAPMYIAEVSPARLRGRLGSLQQMAIVLGIFAALLTNYGIVSASGGAGEKFWLGFESWRWMFWSEIPAAVLYGVCALFIAESPRYLLMKGKAKEAEQVLLRIATRDETAAVLDEAARDLRKRQPLFRDLAGEGSRLGLQPIVWVGIAVAALQQFVGINVIFYYSSVLWRAVGYTEADSLKISVITSVVNIVTTVLAISLVDKLGRRPLLITGSAGMTVTLGVMAYTFGTAPVDALGNPALTGLPAQAALWAANLYVFFFGMSWGPVVWVMLGEMFPTRLKGPALSLAGSANWVANFAVSALFPTMSKSLGLGWSYGIYAAMAVVSLIVVLKFVRETKGRRLEEM